MSSGGTGSPFPLEKRNVVYVLCGKRSGSKANQTIQRMLSSASLTTPSVAACGATTVWANGPAAPPPNSLFSNDNNGLREWIKMQNLCAAYMRQDATDEMRNKMRTYTDEHFNNTKMFIEQTQNCELHPEDRPVLKRAIQYAHNNDAPIVTLNARQCAKRKLESLVWLQQQLFDFRIIEMPSLTRENLHHAVEFASDDIQVIAGKTRAALQQIRTDIASGKAHISHAGNMISKLGAPDPAEAQEAKSKKVLERTMSLYNSHLKDMRANGLSYGAMAERLNKLSISPPFNTVFDKELQQYITFKTGDAQHKIWHATSVRNYFLRGELNADKNKAGTSDEKGGG
tara:strand:+ start:578 stop:1603 length:1026 start_codon:yes stop_codon:yes gene_type:complete